MRFTKKYPCPTFMGCRLFSESLKDKAIMAELLEGTEFIPKTLKVTQRNPRFEEVEKEIKFPCWIRATEGTGGLGSLKLNDISSYRSWLLINGRIPEFTVSEFLSGRHLANQMLLLQWRVCERCSVWSALNMSWQTQLHHT